MSSDILPRVIKGECGHWTACEPNVGYKQYGYVQRGMYVDHTTRLRFCSTCFNRVMMETLDAKT